MTFEPNESALLVFQPMRRELPLRGAGAPSATTKIYTLDRVPTPAARPWGRPGGSGLTVGPVPADPYTGKVEVVPGDLGRRFFLELVDLAPEEAARVTFNGQDAGGFISRPLRLEVTRWIKAGENSVHIEPFSPREAKLCVY
jgi:hypothetical protein